jgi:hypothetical protein
MHAPFIQRFGWANELKAPFDRSRGWQIVAAQILLRTLPVRDTSGFLEAAFQTKAIHLR